MMRIKKIIKIDNFTSYSYFDWDRLNPAIGGNPNDPGNAFKVMNILFGENGNGKSKLVTLFKSLNGDGNPLAKHRDRETESQQINVELSDGTQIEYNGESWSSDSLSHKFIVFDKLFTDTFVHSIGPESADTAQRRQQRGKNILYLGNFGAYNEEIERISRLSYEISRRSQEFVKSENDRIESLLSNSTQTPDDLRANSKKLEGLQEADLENVRAQLRKSRDKCSRLETALSNQAEIAALTPLKTIDDKYSLSVIFEHEDGEVETRIEPVELFAFTVSKGVQATLHKIVHKREFIESGVSLITDKADVCPFCEQPIRNGDLIQVIRDYQGIFDRNFADQQTHLNEMLTHYQSVLEGIRDCRAPRENEKGLDDATRFSQIEENLPAFELSESERAVINAELSLIHKKRLATLTPIEGTSVEAVQSVMQKANVWIDNYNQTVSTVNSKITKLKKDSQEGTLRAEKEIIEGTIKGLELDIFGIEYRNAVLRYLSAVKAQKLNEKTLESLDRIYRSLKTRILEEFNEFVESYFELIQGFVREINPAMEVLDLEGKPSYDLRNKQDPAQCGFRINYKGADRTKDLSEGERQTVALAFFFAQLRKATDKDRIVVFDDPITSFDAGKRRASAEIIKRETASFSQSFVLTCDPLFREYCLKQMENRNFYYIFMTRGSSAICHAPSNKETIYQAFESAFRDLESIHGTNENVVVFGQMLRFCIETKVKEEYFGYGNDNLSDMIKTVAEKGKAGLEKLIDNKDSIIGLYNYCNTGGLAHYPRDGSTSWNELKDKIRQYLDLRL